MALTVAELNAKLTADTRDFNTKLKGAQGSLGSFEKGLKGLGTKLAGAFAAREVAQFAMSAINAARDVNESMSKVQQVFGASAAQIRDWADGASKDFGLSARAALDAAGTFGNMFTQLGVGREQAAAMSQQLTELAADFASFHNANIEDVILAQTSAFRGEYDALQRFLPAISAAAVEQKALEMTGKKSTDMLTVQEKALAVNALMFEGAGAAAGDFDRTSGSLANQQRTLGAEMENAQAVLGQKLQPVMLEVVQWLNSSGIPGFIKFAEVVGEGMADAAAFAIGALADLASGVAIVLEKVDQFIPKMEGVPERLKQGVTEMRAMEAGLHAVDIELKAGTAASNAYTEGVKGQTVASKAGALTSQQVAKQEKELAQARKEAAEAAERAKDAEISLRDAKQAIGDTQYDLNQATKEYNDLLATGGVDMEKVKSAQDDLIGVQKDLEKAIRDVEDAQLAVKKALEPADPKDLAKAQRGLEGANDDVTMAEIGLRDAQDDLNQLMTSGSYTADELTAAQIRVEEAERRVADMKDRVIEAQGELNELQQVGTTQSDAYKTATENLKTAEENAKTATEQFHEKQQALNEAQAVAPGYADAVTEAAKRLREANDNADDAVWGLEKAQRALNDALNATPKNVTTTVTRNETVNIKHNTTHELGSVKQASVAGRSGTIWVPSDFVGPLQNGWARLPTMGPYSPEQRVAAQMLGVPVLHQGGIVPGPRGADVPAILQAGERVIPAGGGGMAGGIVVNVTAGVGDPVEIGRQVQAVLLQLKRRTGDLGLN